MTKNFLLPLLLLSVVLTGCTNKQNKLPQSCTLGNSLCSGENITGNSLSNSGVDCPTDRFDGGADCRG